MCLGQLRPRRSEQIDGSRWGVSCHWIADKHALSTEQQLEQLAETGAKWAVVSPNWDFIERKEGEYNWDSPEHRLDTTIEGMVKRKIAPILQIYGGNRLYTPFNPLYQPDGQKAAPQPGTEVPKLIGDPTAHAAWRAFVEALVRRYHRHVKVWEVWNEPNTAWFWKPAPDAKAYGQMVKEVADIVRRSDPKAVILAGSMANVSLDFFRGVLESDGAASFNFASCHPYGAVPEERDGEINGLRKLLTSRGKSSVVWQSECGFPSSGETSGWGWGGPWDETKQAKWLLRRLLCDASLDMKVSIYFVLNDYPSIIEAGPTHPKNGQSGPNRKGLYRWDSWDAKPARYAFNHLAGLIDQRFEAKPVPITIELLAPGSFGQVRPESIRTFTLREKTTGAPLVAYWLPVPMQTDLTPGKIKLSLEGRGLKEAVLVDLLDGRVYRPTRSANDDGRATFESLPLADSPLVLCDRAVVEPLAEP